MSKILELIRNEEVKWVSLGEVFKNIVTGKLNANKREENGIYPFYTCDEKPYRINTYAFDCEALLVSGNGSKVGHINYYKGKFNAYQRTYVLYDLKENNDIKYIYYYLKFALKKYINNNIFKGSIPFITMPILTEFKIPIPSLETQRKIVDILDRYTKSYEELKECLAKEKDLRIKQYEYYREKLLSEEYLIKKTKELCGEDAKVEVKTFEEIGKFTRGNGLQKKDFSDQGYPVIHYGQIYTKYGFSTRETISYTNELIFSKLRKANKGDILIATTSENLKDVGKSVVWLGEKEIGYSGDMYMYRTSENPKFIAYYFQTVNYQKQKEKKVSGTKLIRIHGDDMGKFTIPIPPLKVQEHIVEILDKFDKLTNDIKEGLPKEIELRTKQYEYYREQLLSFAKYEL